ncbi:SGNH/GDSL hydrolase family protein [Ancylobacter defluvii]|uniref:SGNH hydrolase-type esterase domain-containing protein n=1 Tax=Ancylobacter defluvii TaxID=1282440 RepID=A0A9W6JTU4_9HYPH|nr:DUF459 domain-containing protein [Ancylobacter defluvii]MBS7587263.1 DUF459 domain-containing protein [Ancylobacter defluvii]GLK81950.1 hypothetical protein GCM10017653_00190 [Ancylobacter defluvii]
MDRTGQRRRMGPEGGAPSAWLRLAGSVLCLLLLALPEAPALAQADWFRPPADVGQPSRAAPPQRARQPPQRRQQQAAPVRQASPQQPRGWNPFQPLIDLFQPQDQPRYAPGRPRDLGPPPPAVAAPARPAVETPAEPRGSVYATAAAARAEQGEDLKGIVLVLGDEYADALAQGLADAFAADRKGIAVVGHAESGSGFAPASAYDWINGARRLVASEAPSAIVMFAGSADLAPIQDTGGAAELFDERWRAIYGRRIDDLLLGLKLQGRPVVLVGLPPVDDAAASERNARLNELLGEHAERAGVIFVEVWDGFVDENGQFMMSGPAVDGQRRRLRTANGLGFTRAGGRKLAFFVDRDLGPRLEHEELPVPGDPVAARPSIIMLTGAGAGVGARTLVGAPGAALAPPPQPSGEAVAPESQDGTLRLLVRGEPLPAVSGRTDDFSWTPPKRAGDGAAPQAAPESTGAAKTATP